MLPCRKAYASQQLAITPYAYAKTTPFNMYNCPLILRYFINHPTMSSHNLTEEYRNGHLQGNILFKTSKTANTEIENFNTPVGLIQLTNIGPR